jgi:hypothetical protein
MATDVPEEEIGLLADIDDDHGGLVASRKKVPAHSAAAPVDSAYARAIVAWQQPVGESQALPNWLVQRLVPTLDEQDCLSQLRQMADVAYSGEDPIHERTLRRLFAAVRGPEEARGLPSGGDPRWKDLGFQSDDPRTDFRGGGLLALQNMCHLAENYPDQIGEMLRESTNKRTEYLFAAACVNISCMVVLLLGLNTRHGLSPAKGMPCPANAIARKNFAKVLSSTAARSAGKVSTAEVLGELFACAAMKLHAEWLALCSRKPEATMLNFGEALGATAVSLERMLDGLQGGDQPVQSVFAVLDFVKPEHRLTKCQVYLYRWTSAILEVVCRLIAVVRALMAGLKKGSFAEV